MREWWKLAGVGNAFALVAVLFGFLSTPAAGAQPCPNELFRAGPGLSLPDCRAYERASPADKNGGAVEGFPDLLTTSTDGSSVTFFTQAGTGIPATGGAVQDFPTYLAKKEGEAWSTQRLMPPQSLGQAGDFLGATPDHRFAFVEASLEGTGPDAGRGLFMIDTTDGSVQTIVPNSANREGPPVYNESPLGYAIDGASLDGSRVLFETSVQILQNATPEVDNLYLWSRATGAVTLVGVLPGVDEAPERGSFGGAYEWFLGKELSKGGARAGLAVQVLNAVNPDATQAFFTAGETGQLYLRRGLAGSSPETIYISKPNPGVVDPNEQQPAAFQEATPDGSKAFFLSSGKLTADANTGTSDEGRDLYMWDSGTDSLLDITPDATDELGAQVQGLLGINEAGTAGYFVARGVLTTGAQAGENNLYRFDTTTAPASIEFIATLESGSPATRLPDIRNWSPRSYSKGSGASPPRIQPTSFTRTSRVSPDGRTLIFTSVRPLTGYGNENEAGSECFSGRCAEIFRYSLPPGASTGGSLACISCDADGALPLGSAHLQSALVNGGNNLPKGVPVVGFLANLSESADQVFFESPDPLLPADTNGTSGCPLVVGSVPACQDVYEWEAPGTPNGSCVVPEVEGGCLYLLSTGKSAAPSFFAGASTDGQTAFIVTSSRLVPEDTDSASDAYAVRVGGGLASQFRAPTVGCSGEDCLASPSGPPATSGIGSADVEGPHNVEAKHKHKKHKHKKHKHKKQNHQKAGRNGRGHTHSARLGREG